MAASSAIASGTKRGLLFRQVVWVELICERSDEVAPRNFEMSPFRSRDPWLLDRQSDRQREARFPSGTELPSGGMLGASPMRVSDASGRRLLHSTTSARYAKQNPTLPAAALGWALVFGHRPRLLKATAEGGKVFARVTRLKGDPARVDESIQFAREQILPRARQMQGWKGVVSLADRGTGDGLLITLWETEEAMNASAEQAKGLRAESYSEGEGETGVHGYEVMMLETT
jgi:heme-degrading monooxygenase HmoA